MSNPAKELRISGEQARVIIINCHSLLRRRYAKIPLWSLVGDVTGHGSGYSIEICRTANLDPNQLCGGRSLRDLVVDPAASLEASPVAELIRTREVLRQVSQYFGECTLPLAAAVRERLAWPGTVKPCPRCGSSTQVWPNQLTGKLTCHRAGCHVEVGATEVKP